MRILVITNMLPVPEAPNAGRFIEQQINALKRMGLDVEVIFLNRRKEGMRIYALFHTQLLGAIRLFKPDLIHVMYGGIMSWLVRCLVRDRPVLITFHGSDLLGQPFERPLRKFLSACGVMASRLAAKRCDGVVAVAEHLLKALPTSIPGNNVQVIPCGIDLDLFKPIDHSICLEKLGWQKGNFHILFQNSGDPVKRPDLAYAAVERLKNLGVKAELHELRIVPYEQVPIWLNASDVLLVTSYHEGSPTIVKEALACNLPIVSVAVGDIPERIKKIEGCHIATSDAPDLAEKLHRVRMNATRIDGRGAVQQISVDYSAAKLSQFYNLVLKAQNTKRDSNKSRRSRFSTRH